MVSYLQEGTSTVPRYQESKAVCNMVSKQRESREESRRHIYFSRPRPQGAPYSNHLLPPNSTFSSGLSDWSFDKLNAQGSNHFLRAQFLKA